MPFYVISHTDDMTLQQRDDLAAAITTTHTTLFTTPSLFVNVKFEHSSETSYYVGGKRVRGDQDIRLTLTLSTTHHLNRICTYRYQSKNKNKKGNAQTHHTSTRLP